MTLVDIQGRQVPIGSGKCENNNAPNSAVTQSGDVVRYYSAQICSGWSGEGVVINGNTGPFNSTSLNILSIIRNDDNHTAQINGVSLYGVLIQSSWGSESGIQSLAEVHFSNQYGTWYGIASPSQVPNSCQLCFAIEESEFVQFYKEATKEGTSGQYGGAGSSVDPFAGMQGSGDFIGDLVEGSGKLGGNLTPYRSDNNVGYHCYILNKGAQSKLIKCLYAKSSDAVGEDNISKIGATLWNVWENKMFNPIESILSHHVLPQQLVAEAINSSIPTEGIKVAGTFIGLDPTGDEQHESEIAKCVTNITTEYDFGKVDIPEVFADFNDYVGTSIEVYCPFCGVAQLPPSSCIGGYIRLEYRCAVDTGDVEARIYTKCKNKDVEELAANLVGNASHVIPVAASYDNTLKLISGTAGGIMATIAGAATLNPLLAVGGLGATAMSLASYESHTTTTGNLSGKSQVENLTPYVSIINNIPIHSVNENDIRGIQLFMGGTVAGGITIESDGTEIQTKYSGFTKFQSVDLDGIHTATDAQKEEIERLLKEGVYL
jgi:hypothetical protein